MWLPHCHKSKILNFRWRQIEVFDVAPFQCVRMSKMQGAEDDRCFWCKRLRPEPDGRCDDTSSLPCDIENSMVTDVLGIDLLNCLNLLSLNRKKCYLGDKNRYPVQEESL